MDTYDNIFKKLLEDNAQRQPKLSACLSDEMFASYLDNILDGDDKEKVEEHLVLCEECIKKSIVLNRIKQEIESEPALKAPLEVTQRAKKLVERGNKVEELVQVVIALAKDTIRVLKDTGALIQPMELAFEGGRQTVTKEESNTVVLHKQFDCIRVEVFIERIDDVTCDIEVKTIDAISGSLIDNIRINLALGERELASFLSAHGKVSYKNVAPGSYALIFMSQGKVLGKILIGLEVEG